MKDRVSTYPGRVTLTPVSGQANTYTLARADDPTEVGTPLNKANLLSDAAEQAIWGNADNRTPSKAFEVLGENADQIGDFRVSLRSSLGENWLLANGEMVSNENYPELVSFLNQDPTPTKQILYSNTYAQIGAIGTDGNGLWLAGGIPTGTPWTFLRLYYANSPLGPWTAVPEANSTISNGSRVNIATYQSQGIIYLKNLGLWLAGGYTADGSPPYMNAFYSADPINGPWYQMTTDLYQSYTYAMHEYNGTVVFAGGGYGNNGYLFKTTDPRNGWTFIKQSSHYYCVGNHKGVWIAGRGNGIEMSSDLSTWTAVPGLPNTTYLCIASDGETCAVVKSGSGQVIYVSTDAGGTWTLTPFTPVDLNRRLLVYTGEEWVYYGYYGASSSTSTKRVYMYKTKDIASGVWEGGEIASGTDLYVYNGAFSDDGWVTVGYPSSNGYTSNVFLSKSNSQATLPTASEDYGNVFIKAKEG